jgi:serine/threonine protein kinase
MAPRARDYKPGERVPGTVYQVARLIGAGGMGTVYDVEDTTIGKKYVLKTLHPQLGTRDDLARRMQNEARTLAKLGHPNIVDVITAGVTDDDMRLPFYVMERLNGQSLRMVLEKRGQLDLPHAYHIAIDLLDALDHAHDKGVIHRDVKPDNIFLHRTAAGVTVTKLLDFGILSLLDATMRETAGRFLGTLRYAAPEQLRGEKPTPKVDVYAATLVLYEMIAARGPFDDEGDAHKIASAHLHKVPPPLSHYVVIPRELDALVNAGLAKLPEQRPRDAFSFAASLRNLKKALSGSNNPDSTENRATAVALVGGQSSAAPYVHVQSPPTPQAPYVISPAAPVAPESVGTPLVGAQTTQRGMSAPPLGPTLAGPEELSPTATSSQSVDRAAPTGTYAPGPLPPPQYGTGPLEPQAGGPTLPSDAPPPAALQPFRWPVEAPVARSEEPHTRTLSGPIPTPPRNSSPIVAAILVTGALVAVAGGLLALRAWGTASAANAARPAASQGAAGVPTLAPPPAVEPVVVLPAPTMQPPALDDEPRAPAPAASPSASASTSSRQTPARVPPTRPQQAPASTSPARPGPGF